MTKLFKYVSVILIVICSITSICNNAYPFTDTLRPAAAGMMEDIRIIEALEQEGGWKRLVVPRLKISRYKLNQLIDSINASGNEPLKERLRKASIRLPQSWREIIAALEKAETMAEAIRITGKKEYAFRSQLRRLKQRIEARGNKVLSERLEKALLSFPPKMPKYTQVTIDALRETRGDCSKAGKLLGDITREAVRQRVDRIRKRPEEPGCADILDELNIIIPAVLPVYTFFVLQTLIETECNIKETARILEKTPEAVYGNILHIRETAVACGMQDLIRLLDMLDKLKRYNQAYEYLHSKTTQRFLSVYREQNGHQTKIADKLDTNQPNVTIRIGIIIRHSIT